MFVMFVMLVIIITISIIVKRGLLGTLRHITNILLGACWGLLGTAGELLVDCW